MEETKKFPPELAAMAAMLFALKIHHIETIAALTGKSQKEVEQELVEIKNKIVLEKGAEALIDTLVRSLHLSSTYKEL